MEQSNGLFSRERIEMTTTFTQAQLTALEAAIASGTTEFNYQGRVVKYRSLSEMQEVRAMMKTALEGTESKRTSRVYMTSRRGL